MKKPKPKLKLKRVGEEKHPLQTIGAHARILSSQADAWNERAREYERKSDIDTPESTAIEYARVAGALRYAAQSLTALSAVLNRMSDIPLRPIARQRSA